MVLTEEEFNYYRSEKYAIEREQEENNWHAQYDALIEETIKHFNNMLCEPDHQSLSQIQSTFESETFSSSYSRSQDMINMYIFYTIYKLELEEDIHPNIFDTGTSFNQLLYIMQSIKFYIWRFEFCDEPDALDNLWEYCLQNRLSQIAILNLAAISACKKESTLKQLTFATGDE